MGLLLRQLTVSARVITTGNNQGQKVQKDTGTGVNLSVNCEDYVAHKDILAK